MQNGRRIERTDITHLCSRYEKLQEVVILIVHGRELKWIFRENDDKLYTDKGNANQKLVKMTKRRKTMKKRVVSLLLCTAMLTSLLTGCGGNSGGGSSEGDSDELVTIVMPMATTGDAPSALEEVEAEMNKITEEEIGVHVVIEPIPFANLSSQQTLAISSGDQMDLVLALWEGGVGNYVESGALIELTDLLDEYGQDIMDTAGTAMAGGYYQNKLYAVPNVEVQGHSYGFMARKDMVEELGFEFSTDQVYTIDDLEALFAAFKEKYGDGYYCVAGTTSNSEFFNYLYGHVDAMGSSGLGFPAGGLIDCLDKSNTTIENVYASDEYMEYAERMYDWAQKGYFSSDAATNTDDGTAQIASGYYLGQFNTADAMNQTQFSAACATDMVLIPIVDTYSMTGMFQQVLWGISSNCEHPDKAMQFLNMLYSDAELVRLLMFGIEGEHYEVVEQGEVEYEKVIDFPEGVDAMNSTYYITLGVFGNQNLYPVWVPADLSQYDLRDELNEIASEESRQSVALNYAFDSSELATEFSAVSSVISQYGAAIACGAVDPATQVPAFVSALEAAGIDELIDANQEQFDAFLAENASK